MLNRALRLLRTYHQLTQVELAKRLGICNSYLSEIESGDKSPPLDLLREVLGHLQDASIFHSSFSESLAGEGKRGGKLRVAAADETFAYWNGSKNAMQSKKTPKHYLLERSPLLSTEGQGKVRDRARCCMGGGPPSARRQALPRVDQ